MSETFNRTTAVEWITHLKVNSPKMDWLNKLHWSFREQIFTRLFKLSQKIKRKGKFSNLFYLASMTSILRLRLLLNPVLDQLQHLPIRTTKLSVHTVVPTRSAWKNSEVDLTSVHQSHRRANDAINNFHQIIQVIFCEPKMTN